MNKRIHLRLQLQTNIKITLDQTPYLTILFPSITIQKSALPQLKRPYLKKTESFTTMWKYAVLQPIIKGDIQMATFTTMWKYAVLQPQTMALQTTIEC